MSIDVNGDTIPYVKGETVTDLLARMNYVFPMLVVAVDGKLVQELLVHQHLQERFHHRVGQLC
jgi:sulfur carrier protein ThiS